MSNPLGAFSIDIHDSSQLIEMHGQDALQSFARFFADILDGYLPDSDGGWKGDYWIPGDALWGLMRKIDGKKNLDESVTENLARLVVASAMGLRETWERKNEFPFLERIQFTGSVVVGPVLSTPVREEALTLHNGEALIACKRLESECKKPGLSTIVVGFYLSETSAESLQLSGPLGMPAIPLEPIEDLATTVYQQKMQGFGLPGVNVEIPAIQTTTGQRYMRFKSLGKRAKGLKSENILATTIHLVRNNHQRVLQVYPIIGNDKGDSANLELSLSSLMTETKSGSLGKEKESVDMYEIVDAIVAGLEGTHRLTALSDLYGLGDVIVTPSVSKKKIAIHSSAKRHRLRPLSTRPLRDIDPVKEWNFQNGQACWIKTADSSGRLSGHYVVLQGGDLNNLPYLTMTVVPQGDLEKSELTCGIKDMAYETVRIMFNK